MQAPIAGENFIAIDSARVRYVEAGSGLPLLLIHGLGHSSTAWRRSIDLFAQQRHVFAIDLPGFGGSDIPHGAALDPEYLGHAVGAIVDALGLEGVDAIGHSAGALAILVHALDAPKRFRRIVLANPAGFTPAPDSLLGTAAASLARLLVSMPRNRTMTRALYATAFYNPRAVDDETVDELVRRRTDARVKAAVRKAFASHFEFCRNLEPFHARVATLDVPILVIWGRDDRLFRATDIDVARRVMSGARIEVIERCGHCPQIECPERFADLALEFLAAQ